MHLAYTCTGLSQSKTFERPEVFVVDGDASERETLESLIRSAGWQPRPAASAEDFLERPRGSAPSCLLVELHLPGMSGLELQRLVFDRTEMPVIFVSRHANVQATVQAMKAGAFEFLTKPVGKDELLDAIGRAIEHSHVAQHRLARVQAFQERLESLSRREREVMSLVVSGKLNKQVGGELGISEITVKAHRGKVMRKMRVGSLAELVNIVVTLGGGFAGANVNLHAIASQGYA